MLILSNNILMLSTDNSKNENVGLSSKTLNKNLRFLYNIINVMEKSFSGKFYMKS